MNISNATMSVGAIAVAAVIVGPLVWSSAMWAADIELQVEANAKQIDRILTEIDKRDIARTAEHLESADLTRQLLERIDKLIELPPAPITP